MIRAPEEIIEELEKLKTQREEAERQYKKALAVGFKKHEECCPDVCDIINQAIYKLNYNITQATKIKEKTISRRVKTDLLRDITTAESQIKKLKTLKDELYAKQVCDCKNQ